MTDNLLGAFIDLPGLCAEFDCGPRTIRRYENQPDGLPSVMIGGRKYFRLETVRDWILRRERRPNPRRAA